MKNVNKVTLVGRLTRDPELHERAGRQVCDMRIAVGSRGVAPMFIDVVAFHELAATAAELKKGAEIEVIGCLRYSEWTSKPKGRAKAGRRCSKHSVIARELVTQ